jgi:chaperonin GroEL
MSGSARQGFALLDTALAQPLACIAANCGLDPEAIVKRVAAASPGTGLDARSGALTDMVAAGIVDPVKVSISAVRNAVSVAALILTTQTLIAKKPDYIDPTAGPALGGGAERLGRA